MKRMHVYFKTQDGRYAHHPLYNLKWRPLQVGEKFLIEDWLEFPGQDGMRIWTVEKVCHCFVPVKMFDRTIWHRYFCEVTVVKEFADPKESEHGE